MPCHAACLATTPLHTTATLCIQQPVYYGTMCQDRPSPALCPMWCILHLLPRLVPPAPLWFCLVPCLPCVLPATPDLPHTPACHCPNPTPFLIPALWPLCGHCTLPCVLIVPCHPPRLLPHASPSLLPLPCVLPGPCVPPTLLCVPHAFLLQMPALPLTPCRTCPCLPVSVFLHLRPYLVLPATQPCLTLPLLPLPCMPAHCHATMPPYSPSYLGLPHCHLHGMPCQTFCHLPHHLQHACHCHLALQHACPTPCHHYCLPSGPCLPALCLQHPV